MEITTVVEWDMGHRLGRGYKSKCKNLHGHRYRAEITVTAPDLDEHGMVIDFGVIKKTCKDWIDECLDHATIVDIKDSTLLEFLHADDQKHFAVSFSTTVEQITPFLATQIQFLLNQCCPRLEIPTPFVSRLRVFETPNNWCDWSHKKDLFEWDNTGRASKEGSNDAQP